MPENTPNTAPDGRPYVERRRKKDWVTKAVPILSAVGWLAAFVIFFFLDRASPKTEDLFTRLFNTVVVSTWNTTLLRYAFFTIVGVFVICLAGFFLNMLRSRRKSDKFNVPIIILGLIALAGIIIMAASFGGIMF